MSSKEREEITNLNQDVYRNTDEISLDELDDAAGGAVCGVNINCPELECIRNKDT